MESNSQEKERPVEEVERPTPAVVEGAAPVALPRGQGSACTGAWRPSADFGTLASHLTASGNSRANHAAASATLLPASPALPSLLQVGPTIFDPKIRIQGNICKHQ